MKPPREDPHIDRQLLSKADALIRRNRPDGVGLDAEELPLLTDVLDEDLPELTDAIEIDLDDAVDASSFQPVPQRLQEAFSLSLDLEEAPQPASHEASAPKEDAADVVQAVNEAMARVRDEMAAEREHAIQEVSARVRADVLQEARLQQQRAVQAALAQGREEAEINHWPALQEARKEAMQTAAMHISERLIELDAQIAQSVNAWLSREMPQLIAGELAGLAERLRVQTAAHMRATLLPEISEQVSMVLESALKDDEATG
ncbi:MAG: hypothetical protein CGU28_00430 [Candidatus Dactylopiibacterium carminicum]|uniref:Uncharacterized protein n=1 Tax=Candidatus Dactylopiibacterium carminicum TaxID=857335 RepID=A0A272EYY5_9RHOO|nr:hypothetical protein [Candidatus Dactylopiibacterium carminicum]KAF7600838.1 hypothetical protein BGI27_00345 [Candidatus Dactylopiibacterium carminicum]PAS95337.1 MAG: hypothetical protein CGU29_00380 [Candidatus Dactylopiibacterium carminicum]PAS98651.1 MAG: hypothetical protein CGU28_00430 [Candidatus Dactylopiibacterium carminicum]PAT00842.1 MAG: hypothetical protein BSR46_00345 [Candidatus Dactylopiibacterium carminicum]